MAAALENDYKNTIIEELDVMMKKSRNENDRFRALAYDKVLKQLKNMDGPVHTYDDLKDITGIGSGIEKKIKEILLTGRLQVAEDIKEEQAATLSLFDTLLNIHGIGAVKARNLVDKAHITSIDDLREKSNKNPKLLNAQQKVGLKYYEELLERIPRSEMKKHEKLILKELGDSAIIVGSYRRELSDSGDIDVLISESILKADDLKKTVEKMQKSGYITDVLALGSHKCMAVVKLPATGAKKEGKKPEKHRRLDILLTPENEFIPSVIYFTGSQKFNIEMRKVAINLGYSLSEHGIKKKRDDIPDVPVFKKEKDVFDFLGMDYVEPKNR